MLFVAQLALQPLGLESSSSQRRIPQVQKPQAFFNPLSRKNPVNLKKQNYVTYYVNIESRTIHQCVFSLVGVVPGEPTDVVVTEATKSYVVLAWKPPVQRGHEGVMYYIEKVGKLIVESEPQQKDLLRVLRRRLTCSLFLSLL